MQDPGTPRPAGPRRATFLSVVCALLAVVTVVLALQNRRLKVALAARPAHVAAQAPRPRLQVGDALAPFTLKRSDGDIEAIGFDGSVRWTLIFVFAETCPACPAVMPDWARLAPELGAASTRVVGIRLDPPRDGGQADAAAPSFPVFALHDAREVPLDKLATVPLTALLDEWGTVLWVHYGELGEARVAEVLTIVRG